MRPLLLAALLALSACAPHGGGGFVVTTGPAPGGWAGPGWHAPRHHVHGPRWHRHGWNEAHAWNRPHWDRRRHDGWHHAGRHPGWGRSW